MSVCCVMCEVVEREQEIRVAATTKVCKKKRGIIADCPSIHCFALLFFKARS